MDLRRFKEAVKTTLFRLLPRDRGYANLRVLTGLARGAVLRLDVRAEGSYWLGTYDKWVFDDIPFRTLVIPGSVAWDCGSYVGFYAAVFRKLVGASGEVHAFEASTPNYERLRELPTRNHWSNVFVHNLAIGPDHSTLEFVENLGGSSGPFGLTKAYASGVDLKIARVPCCGIDELVYERGIPMPDFIKLDLESAEQFALRNGDRVFSRKRPTILVEVHGAAAMAATAEFLERHRYEGVPVGSYSNTTRRLHAARDFAGLVGDWQMLLCRPLEP